MAARKRSGKRRRDKIVDNRCAALCSDSYQVKEEETRSWIIDVHHCVQIHIRQRKKRQDRG